jgi:hypothetical protein
LQPVSRYHERLVALDRDDHVVECRSSAAAKDEGLGAHLAFGRAHHELRIAAAHEVDALLLEQLGAEVRRLLGEPLGQLTRGDLELGREIAHRLGGVEADELAAERLRLEGDRQQPPQTAASGGREARRPPR